MGGDREEMPPYYIAHIVSIHAPAWGATFEPQLTAAIRHFTAFPRTSFFRRCSRGAATAFFRIILIKSKGANLPAFSVCLGFALRLLQPDMLHNTLIKSAGQFAFSKIFYWRTGKPCSTPQCWHCFPLSMHKPKLAAAGELAESCGVSRPERKAKPSRSEAPTCCEAAI